MPTRLHTASTATRETCKRELNGATCGVGAIAHPGVRHAHEPQTHLPGPISDSRNSYTYMGSGGAVRRVAWGAQASSRMSELLLQSASGFYRFKPHRATILRNWSRACLRDIDGWRQQWKIYALMSNAMLTVSEAAVRRDAQTQVKSL
eukprot:GHVU01118309.1.p1 GENE.GHVU01118309.1~~GHVU01118309.1.p1  ORF type:complete len:148 (+),score=7.16 GHVU01118309.1:233-676(+)